MEAWRADVRAAAALNRPVVDLMVPRSVRLSSPLILQILIVAAVLFAFWHLASTAAHNLRELRIASGFGFLHRESGFIVGETTFLPQNAQDTYLRALLVGVLNTLRVALLAILFSTLTGGFIALARFSRNWLLAKLAGGYVEILRNTPLIVQLFFWYAVLTENLPGPNEAWSPVRGVFVSNRGVAFPWPQMPEPSVWSISAAILIAGLGVLAAFLQRRKAFLAIAALGMLLILPLLSILSPWEYPEMSGFGFIGGGSLSPEFIALLLGLSLYTSAFIGEILRAGFLAVGQGQSESGRALGLSEAQVMRFIVAPQALRTAVPPVTSQYLNCLKNSSLAVAIGYPDLVSIANTTINQTGQAIEGFALIIFAYLTVSLAIAALMNLYNRRVALRGTVS